MSMDKGNEDQFVNRDTDWFLREIVKLANNRDVTFPVTLNIGGLLITGKTISMKKYFNSIDDLLFPNNDEGIFSSYVDPSDDDDDVDINLEPNYIHLESAFYIYPNSKPIPNNQSLTWRGRISEVDGFTFGILEVS